MKRWFWLFWLLIPCLTHAQNVRFDVDCSQGGKLLYSPQVISPTPNHPVNVVGSFPSCSITVYLTGSSPYTKATLYDANGIGMSNPFTADTTGHGYFYADGTKHYDWAISGTGITSPFGLSDQIKFPLGLGNGGPVIDATTMPGADPSIQVSNAMTAVLAAGGGEVHAEGFNCPYPGCAWSQTVTVGDVSHPVVLFLPPSGWFNRGSGVTAFLYHSSATIIGYQTLFYGNDSVAAIGPAYEVSGRLQNVKIYGLQLFNAAFTGIGLQVGSTALGVDVAYSIFEDILAEDMDIGFSLQAPNVCTCYNKFYNNSALYNATYDVQSLAGTNKNEWYSLTAQHTPTGIYDHGTANSYYSSDLENLPTHAWEFSGNDITMRDNYEEAAAAGIFDSGAANDNVKDSRGSVAPTDSSGNGTNFWSDVANWGKSSQINFHAVVNSTNIVASTTPAAWTLFKVGYSLFQTASGSGGTCATSATVTVTLAWTDPSGTAQTKVESALNLPPVLAAGATQQDEIRVPVQTASALSYSIAWADGNCTTQPRASIYLYAQPVN